MKKIAFSLVTLLALSSSAMAEATDSGFYLGIGYGYLDQSMDAGSVHTDTTTNNVLFQGGFDINKYVGLEARLWESVGSNDATQTGGFYPGTYDVSDAYAWGMYVKPAYPVLENFKVYGLVGYGVTSVKYNDNDVSTNGFSWGVGAEYAINNNISCFVDYTDFIAPSSTDYTYTPSGYTNSIDTDIKTYTVNVGVTYKF